VTRIWASVTSRDDYSADLEVFVDHLGLSDAVLLGNSLGGVNAYQFAARCPEKVRALVVEEIGAEVWDDLSFILAWEGTIATREAQDPVRHTPAGWSLASDRRDIVESGKSLAGDHWNDWLATSRPALLLRGRDSRVTTRADLEQMALRRPNTTLKVLDGGHIIHVDDPAGFVGAVSGFLRDL
jgi:esterase